MTNKWQPIETHFGKYEISQQGVVRTIDGMILKQWKNNQGYCLVRLSQPRITVRVHRLVAKAYIKNPLDLPFVNHKDCNPANNCFSNLEWCTQWQNLDHSAKLGRMQRNYWKGKRSPNALLSDLQVKNIKEEYSKGNISWEKLGKKYLTSKRTIGRIINGESYAMV